MTADPQATDDVADVAETLMREFQRALPLSTISATVLRAQRDLAARVADVGFREALTSLSRARLTQLQMELIA